MEAMEKDLQTYELEIKKALNKTELKCSDSVTKVSSSLIKKDAYLNCPAFWEGLDGDDSTTIDLASAIDNSQGDESSTCQIMPHLFHLRRIRGKMIASEHFHMKIGQQLLHLRNDQSTSVTGTIPTSEQFLHKHDLKAVHRRHNWIDLLRSPSIQQLKVAYMKSDLALFLRSYGNLNSENVSSKSHSPKPTPGSIFTSHFMRSQSKIFPKRVRSNLVSSRGAMDPRFWVWEDVGISTAANRLNWSAADYPLVSCDKRIYLGRIGQTLGWPFGAAYVKESCLEEFMFQMSSTFDSFSGLKCLEIAKPRSRRLRRILFRHGDGSKDVDLEGENLFGLATTGAGIPKSASKSKVDEGFAFDDADSEMDISEAKACSMELNVIRSMLKRNRFEHLTACFGPELVSERIGRGIGRLRNAFDSIRLRSRVLESSAQSNRCNGADHLNCESSEDENIAFIDRQSKYRRFYRAFLKTEDLFKERIRSLQTRAIREYKENESGSRRRSYWPGSPLDRVRVERHVEKDEAIASSKKSKKRKVTIVADPASPTSAGAEEERGIRAYEKSVEMAKQLGLREEEWRTFDTRKSFKPRVRHIESVSMQRPNESTGTELPLGLIGRGRTLQNREVQLIGLDEGEIWRRFGLSKLAQKALPDGLALQLLSRRHFCLVFDEEDPTGQVEVVDVSPLRLIMADSPQQKLEDLAWKLHWEEKGAFGALEAAETMKACRYGKLKSSNYAIWKNEVDEYLKLREKALEVQFHEQPKDLRLRVLNKDFRTGVWQQATDPSELLLSGWKGHERRSRKATHDETSTTMDSSGEEDEDVGAVERYVNSLAEQETNLADRRGAETLSCSGGDGSIKEVIEAYSSDTARHQFVRIRDVCEREFQQDLNEEEGGIFGLQVRKDLAVDWTQARRRLCTALSVRYRKRLVETQRRKFKAFRNPYLEAREGMAERAAYESAWLAERSKRALNALKTESAAAVPQQESEA